MISQSTIDRIIDAANIVDVVSDYVTLRRAGASYKGLCPFHDDKTPSFYVSPAKGLCKCFSCGKGGNVVHFIMEVEQLNYTGALTLLAKKYGIEVEERELTPEQRQQRNERESMYAVNEWASNYFHNIMLSDPDGKAIGLAYFRSRGFRDDILEKFRLGFCLSQRYAMVGEAKKKGYKEEYLVKTGLCFKRDDGSVYDKYSGRVIFPWFSVSGKVIAFGGRVLDSRTKGVNQKYINSPESEVFHKSNELYGIFQAKKEIVKQDRVYMVEGYTDVISMHQCGIENVVANSGTALNAAQIKLLHRFTSNITLLYDGDDAGIHAALRGTDMLLSEGMNVKILLLPDGDDPDSFARKHSVSEYREYIEANQTDFIIFKTNLLLKDAGRDPLKKAQLTKDIVRSISVIPEEIVRSAYIHECGELLKVDEQILLREVVKNRKEEKERLWKEKEREKEREKAAEIRAAENEDSKIKETEVKASDENTENLQKENAQSEATNPIDSQSEETQHKNEPWEFPDEPPFEANSSIPDSHTTAKTEQKDSYAEAHLVSKANAEEKRFIGLERMIMSQIVRHGEQTIEGVDEQGNQISITVIDFVREELDTDGLEFRSPLYTKMLNDAIAHKGDSGFIASRHFLSSPDIEISLEGADMMNDRYQLSKSQQLTNESTSVVDNIVHLMTDYKFEVVEDELRRTAAELAKPEISADSDRCTQIMTRYLNLANVQRKLAKRLGDRVILKN